jgi:hypothetical protein
VVAAAVPWTAGAVPQAPGAPRTETSAVTAALARYLAAARARPLPAPAQRDTLHRILDTLGAIVSGARLKPGEMAVRFVRQQGGTAEATVCASGMRTSAIKAATGTVMFRHNAGAAHFEPVTTPQPG